MVRFTWYILHVELNEGVSDRCPTLCGSLGPLGWPWLALVGLGLRESGAFRAYVLPDLMSGRFDSALRGKLEKASVSN
jgi:hypothetical protein